MAVDIMINPQNVSGRAGVRTAVRCAADWARAPGLTSTKCTNSKGMYFRQ